MSRFRNAFPGIPDPQPTMESLLEVSRMLKESVETLRGLRGLPEERALTQKDIEQGLEISWDQVSVGLPTSFPPSPHGHTIEEVSGLSAALAAKSNVGHGHAFSEITGVALLAQLPVNDIRLTIQPQLQIDASQISNLPSPSSGAERFSELLDVADFVFPVDGEVPIWDDYLEQYVPGPVSGGGGASNLSELSDVNSSLSPSNGQVLGFVSGQWDAVTSSGGGGDSVAAVSGAAVIEHPETEVEVVYDAEFSPVAGRIQVTPYDDLDGWLDGAASAKYSVKDLEPDRFKIAVDVAPGVGKHVLFGWLVIESTPQASQLAGLNMIDDAQLNMI